ncbi:RNA polymerase sigma factor [Nonomuraea sp. 10N515B]|uniref:RNA polymerase sigma factor n=1 Tax=Nonomuraea sp. 10N515B TaxID=3457422 RepID=UPI003FCDF8FE
MWAESARPGGVLPGVREAFAQLSPDDREIPALVGWEGLGSDEIAAVLGCSRGAARLRLHRARKRLARELDARISRHAHRSDFRVLVETPVALPSQGGPTGLADHRIFAVLLALAAALRVVTLLGYRPGTLYWYDSFTYLETAVHPARRRHSTRSATRCCCRSCCSRVSLPTPYTIIVQGTQHLRRARLAPHLQQVLQAAVLSEPAAPVAVLRRGIRAGVLLLRRAHPRPA